MKSGPMSILFASLCAAPAGCSQQTPQPTTPAQTHTSATTTTTHVTTNTTPTDTGHTGTPTSTLALDLSGVLTNHAGCGNVILYAVNGDSTKLLLFIDDDDYGQRAWDAGGTSSTVLDLSTQGYLVYREGESLTAELCTDWPEGTEVITDEWRALSGSASIDLIVPNAPEPWGEYDGTMTLELTNVLLQHFTGVDYLLEPMTVHGAVGFMPG